MLVILSGSSGVGKNTIINKILEDMDNVELMPTVTTRGMRPGEEQGKPYVFVSKEEFLNMIERCEMIEYCEIHGNLYGTNRKIANEKMKDGKILIKDIDVDGTAALLKYMTNVVPIFLKPKSKKQLIERLTGRGEKNIELRLKRYEYEDSMSNIYKYVIINDLFDDTLNRVKKIIIDEYDSMNK